MTNFIPQTNPGASYLAHRAEIDEAVKQVLESGWYISGAQVLAFEREFAHYLGVLHTIGVGNGTDALELSLRACDIGPGDAVFTVSHTAVATVAAIELTGATPVLVDIDPATFTISPADLETALKNCRAGRPRAVIPVHLYGRPADLPAILEIAARYNLYVIEDCAQAHGALFQNRQAGSWGDLATFSFYPTKNLGALGDGGAIVTSNQALAERARQLREYGWRERYISELAGMNSRLDELQAAILRVKLRYLDEENARRQTIAHQYQSLLAHTDLILPAPQSQSSHVYHQYVIRTRQRDALKEFLKAHNIGSLIHYPLPVHLQPAYQNRTALSAGGLPGTEKICGEILSLPMYPQLTDEQVNEVGQTILHWLEQAL